MQRITGERKLQLLAQQRKRKMEKKLEENLQRRIEEIERVKERAQNREAAFEHMKDNLESMEEESRQLYHRCEMAKIEMNEVREEIIEDKAEKSEKKRK
ncbi:Oidioi.mRNA.OKI2018_I69.PAR.g11346.t1.cds [Oikopleura dioica]|uniref:Oidioi.mRNA.OKI2018_I69.PAR.g11346.t1.cds n=1 Tax=Oikopleura dioica TaxID=34765 RepID=A0ABN7RV93_OIKDI|nr:Oidioi.mRNA.OKI2018_I69.PAR.g11346.t1.cds [Oikopleura dioica]